jgi:hypothetical protein
MSMGFGIHFYTVVHQFDVASGEFGAKATKFLSAFGRRIDFSIVRNIPFSCYNQAVFFTALLCNG